MSLNISKQPDRSFDTVGVFQKGPVSSSDPFESIKNIFKQSLKIHIEPSEKELLLRNLRTITTTLTATNAVIENRQEIIRQVEEIISCLENNTSYAEKLWEKKKVKLDKGTIIFSHSLKDVLDDDSFKDLMQAMPEEYRKKVIDCHLDELSLEAKSLETLLKYCPNMNKEALERIGAIWKEVDLSTIIGIWSLFSEISLKERPSVVGCFLKCFKEQDTRYGTPELLIKAISEIDSEDREDVIEFSLKCFHEGIYGYEKKLIISTIAEIDPKDREQVIELSYKCFHEGISGTDKNVLIREIAKIDTQDRENVVELALKCAHEGISGAEKAQLIKTIEQFPFDDRENVLKLASEHFHEGISGSEKVRILQAIQQTSFEDRENVIQLSKRCFHEGISGYEKAQIIQTIAQIPSDIRENVIRLSLECFHEDISGHEKAQILQAIQGASFEDQEQVVRLSLECFHEGISGDEKTEIIQAIVETPSQDRGNVVALSLKYFYEDIPGDEKARIIRTVAQIPSEDQEHVVTLSFKCFHEYAFVEDKIEIIKAIASIPLEERENVVDWSLRCFSEQTDMGDRPEIIKAIAIIPKKERVLINDSSIQDFSENHGLNKDTLLIAYLLPDVIKSEESLSDFSQNSQKYDQEIIASLEQKLSDETLPQKTSVGLAQYADKKYGETLSDEHPLMNRIIELLCINDIGGPKNPFTLFGRLRALRNEPVHFQTPVSETIGLRIGMARLEEIATVSKIERKDLPEKATKEAWYLFINDFKNKVEGNLEKAEEAFSQLDTTWINMEKPLFKDPQNYLNSLFDFQGPVSDIEAKFKAIFNSILSQSNAPRNGQFFTEQEEIFIKQMMAIQTCKTGKQEGIAAVYELLDAFYKYKIQLSPAMTVEELSDLEKKEEVTQFLRDFIKDKPATERELMLHFKNDTLTNAGLFTALFGASSSDQYLIEVEEDDDYVFHLNEAGAHEALSYIRDVEKKELVDYIAGIVRSTIERTISSDTFIEKLIGEKTAQGAHASTYLKNTIGPFIGITKDLTFDRYTAVLSDALVEKSREEILKILFDEITPERLVTELVRVDVPALYLKLFLDEKPLTKEGAKKLLELTGYFE